MKVFISWSGERSRRVAQLLNTWLKCVLQHTQPWISTDDIERGAFWFTEISKALSETSTGIVCLTKENISQPWILFEAGALAKGLSSARVCTVLIDLEPRHIKDPLAQFNHTTLKEESMRKLITTLNRHLGENALDSDTLKNVFDTNWNWFNKAFKEIIDTTKESDVVLETLKAEEVLPDILEAIRGLEREVRKNDVRSSNISYRWNDTFHIVNRFPNTIKKVNAQIMTIPAFIERLVKKLDISYSEADRLVNELRVEGVIKC